MWTCCSSSPAAESTRCGVCALFFFLPFGSRSHFVRWYVRRNSWPVIGFETHSNRLCVVRAVVWHASHFHLLARLITCLSFGSLSKAWTNSHCPAAECYGYQTANGLLCECQSRFFLSFFRSLSTRFVHCSAHLTYHSTLQRTREK